MKKLVKKKTFWSGLALVGWGTFRVISGDVTGTESIILGFTAIFGRAAIAKVEK